MRINVSLPQTLVGQLRSIKERTGLPISQVIQRAVHYFLENKRELKL